MASEDDLAEVRLYAAVPGDPLDWSVSLEAAADDVAAIRLYDGATKGLPYIFQMAPGAQTASISFGLNGDGWLEKSLWVEGRQAGQVALDLVLSNTVLQLDYRDTIELTVVHSDLTLFNGGSDLDNGEAIGSDGSAVPDDNEVLEGGYLLVNWDDDDADGQMNPDGSFSQLPVPDLNETFVQNEDNLAKLVPASTMSLNQGVMELEVTEGADKIKLWTQKTKGSQIALVSAKKTWDLSDPSQRSEYLSLCQNGIWIEGITPSGTERDVAIALRYSHHGQVFASDIVKATVVMINLGNAVYRENEFTGVGETRGHAALVTAFLGPCSRGAFMDDTLFTIIEMQGPTADKTLATITQANHSVYPHAPLTPYGCYTNPSVTYVDRLRILAAAKSLAARGVGYTATDALTTTDPNGAWSGRLDTIAALRCDGLVEVRYEINEVDVWAMRRSDGTYNFNIADQTDNWTYDAAFGIWSSGGNGVPDNLEEHNDFDAAGWTNTLQPATQCGYEAPVNAMTRFARQNLCGPFGSTGGN